MSFHDTFIQSAITIHKGIDNIDAGLANGDVFGFCHAVDR